MDEEQMPRLELLLNGLRKLTEEAASHAAAFSHMSGKLDRLEPAPSDSNAPDLHVKELLVETSKSEGEGRSYYFRTLGVLIDELARVNERNKGTLLHLDQLL